jgi:hypothetical protein
VFVQETSGFRLVTNVFLVLLNIFISAVVVEHLTVCARIFTKKLLSVIVTMCILTVRAVFIYRFSSDNKCSLQPATEVRD